MVHGILDVSRERFRAVTADKTRRDATICGDGNDIRFLEVPRSTDRRAPYYASRDELRDCHTYIKMLRVLHEGEMRSITSRHGSGPFLLKHESLMERQLEPFIKAALPLDWLIERHGSEPCRHKGTTPIAGSVLRRSSTHTRITHGRIHRISLKNGD